MEGDVFGVRIIPPVLQFFNTVPLKPVKLPITVINTSKTSKNVRYYGPKSELGLSVNGFIDHMPNFSLKVKNPEEAVAPGLAVTAVVEYCPMVEKEDRDRIVLTVDGNVIEVPVFAHPCQPLMEVTGTVDFGRLVADSKAAVREIIITNAGSKKGDFKIDYNGNKRISFLPGNGTVPARSEQKVQVEYVATVAGKFHEEAEVHLEGREVMKLTIKGSVIEGALELLSTGPDNTKLNCVRFGSTYYGTDKTECAFLYNNGPEPISFVAILDENAIAQEMGIDLTKSTVATLAGEGEEGKRGKINKVTSLIAVIPNQGTLKPYQKIPIFFRFSPRWYTAKHGWKNQICPPPRKDFALFVRLQIVGASSGFIECYEAVTKKGIQENLTGTYAEVALTGSALPVLLNISPTAKLEFGECSVGEHADVLCTIKNESNVLPTLFEFRRIAHFTAHPPSGKILPGQTQDVIFSFTPKQIGTFKPDLHLDILGQIADKWNPTMALMQVIYTLTVKLVGSSDPITIKPKPKFNPGITPLITNEVGLNVETTFKDLTEDLLPMAVAGSTKTKLHKLRILSKSADFENEQSARVAFPNDRSRSVRPFNEKERYESLFTRSERYNYTDPEYAYDDTEIEKRSKHQLGYLQMIREQREKRLAKKETREFDKTNNFVDIGIKSAAGIYPKKLTQAEIMQESVSTPPPNEEWKILNTKDMATAEKQVVSKRVCEGLNAVPTSPAEKMDCSKWLSPQELHQVVIGPPVINFGQICVKSVSQKELRIINNLKQFIHIVAEIDCMELRQSSPLSQVVPPQSTAVIPIIFESGTKGTFQRSIIYTVNGFFKHHVTVEAEVVPIALELSAGYIILKPSPGMPAEAGFRGVITLYNKQNYAAEFTWSPDLGEKGTAFSIRPASGTVDPKTDLDCEVVWHPSFIAPEEGSFTLFIGGGESRRLFCTAEIGMTNVYFLDQRITFGTAPVNLTTVISSLLHNNGSSHAYFYLFDPHPLPFLTVSPMSGVVPVGGSTEIHVALTPHSIVKFDTKIQVAVRGGKTLELRIAGSVESPEININVSSFNFGGVHCGSSAVIPFMLMNKAISKCRFEVDLTKYKDFSLTFPGCQCQEDFEFQLLNPGKVSVVLEGEESIEGELSFTPKQVAAYDFILPISINYLEPTGITSSEACVVDNSSSHSSVQHHTVNMKPVPAVAKAPLKKVIGTAMRQPLKLDTNRLEFLLPSDVKIQKGSAPEYIKEFSLKNISSDTLKWGIDLSMVAEIIDKGIFKFLNEDDFFDTDGKKYVEGILKPGDTYTVLVTFCPETAGRYQIIIPVVINSAWDKPFQFLEIFGEMVAPKIWFEPESIVLTPVPLRTQISAEFNILALHYNMPSRVIVTPPIIECEDDSKVSPLVVTFLEGEVIKPCSNAKIQVDPCILRCMVTFSSTKPVSFSQPVNFRDEKGNVFKLLVTATADNCILTCYPFLAQHRMDHQIICQQGSQPKGRRARIQQGDRESLHSGEAVLVSRDTPRQITSRPSTSATTSSTFQVSTSSYETSTSHAESSSTVRESRDGALNKPSTSSEFSRHKAVGSGTHSAGSIIFPDEETEEGIFHMEVLMAVQRWFSYQGWPNGPYPVLIPETLRASVSKKSAAEAAKNVEEIPSKTQIKGKTKNKGVYNKLVKTIYDMINFLSGRSIPGIPANVSLPANPVERVKQLYWQHCTLLTFLKCQGACVASILPEYLMTPADFVLWRQLQRSVKMELLQQGNISDAEKIKVDEDIGQDVFEAISKRAWMDVMLQILKVLVLVRVTPKSLKNLTILEKDIIMPTVNPDPLASNIYCVSERILLAWMNYHYENSRTEIWENCLKGGVPAPRWIVNFDYDLMDGIVLASLLGSHMPFLIKTHLQGMYSNPNTAEQCLHNALKVVTAMKYVGIDYDIHAIDITDPNPVSLLLFVSHLYEKLPQCLPKTTVDYVGSLHTVVTRQIKISNTSAKSLVYNVLLAGHDACDFSVPKGNTVTVPAKSALLLSVEFKSRFLRPAEAVLVLVGKRQGTTTGNTLIFNLSTEIDAIKPKSTVKVESPCYELEHITLEVRNPFPEGGNFHIVLIESRSSVGEFVFPSQSRDKKQRFKSKTNLVSKKQDSQTDVIPMNKILEHQESMSVKNSQIPTLQAFHYTNKIVHLDALDSAEVTVDFLPFHVGERQCSVIFLNENIGEFLYSIEAKALDPLPSYLPFVPTKNSVRITGTTATGNTKNKDDYTIYWKCESGSMLKEALLIPMTNMAKERALVIVAQSQMSAIEMQRRQLTGTLMSCSVMAKTLKSLSNNPVAAVSLAKALGPVADVYRVEVDNEYFQVPDMLVMPNQQDTSSKCLPRDSRIKKGDNLPDGIAELVVQFKAREPGIYTASIKLTSIDDVRIYRIECTVTPQGSTAELEFHTPIFQSVTQNIPIPNSSDEDWLVMANIVGNGFHGPSALLVKAHSTLNYPLTFKPMDEEDVFGRLILSNKNDGTEHIFDLVGKGEKPLALDRIQLTCGAKSSLFHTVKVPNVTSKKLTYRVESDLPFVSGEPTITVCPRQTGSYNVVLTPNRRGKFKGVLAFIAGKSPVREPDSDDETVSQSETDSEFHGYHMWYSLEIDAKPPLPERTLTIVCACYKKAMLDVIVRNPTPKEITLKASVRGAELTGPPAITLSPGTKDVYTVTFAPTKVGERRGSLIFFNEEVGEFWYNLVLKAMPPAPTTLPHMECELGSWTRQIINLTNPTHENLDLVPLVTNTNNFTLEVDVDKPVTLKPETTTGFGLKFKPTSLGEGNHMAKIIFSSEQFGDWTFYASGTGLLPTPRTPVVTSSAAGFSSTFFILFRNPTDLPVLADITLSESETEKHTEGSLSPKFPFKLLLKQNIGVRIGPKSSLEIPLSFAPCEVMNYQAYCNVTVQREDGQKWPLNSQRLEQSLHTKEISEIRWVFPIQGIADTEPARDQSVISCAVHDNIDQRLELPLSEADSIGIPVREKTPKNKKPQIPESVLIGNTMATAEEYSFELFYENDDVKEIFEKSLELNFVRHFKASGSGLVTIVFNIRFAPNRIMDHVVELLVKAKAGGFWRFPLRFIATEPPPDDTLLIEANGLGKLSSLGLRLNSQEKFPAAFKAFFENDSDPEFSVFPETGELPPIDSEGKIITVTFLPSVYGKLYNAKLIVQIPNKHWRYVIKGVLPDYNPPRGVSAHPIAGPHPPLKLFSAKKNFIRENLKLLATAVSSPIKGAYLVPIAKSQC